MIDTAALLREVSENTCIARAHLIAGNALLNLRRIKKLAHITAGLSIEGHCVVLGAGPSAHEGLERVGPYTPIIAVNGSWRLCERHDWAPKLVVAAESIDMSENLAGYDGLLALDWAAHPNMFKRPKGARETFWFTDASPFAGRILNKVGLKPIEYSNSAVCAAVAIAFECGADSVELIGVDSCFPKRFNTVYADGAHWGNMKLTRKGKKLHVSNTEKRAKHHIDNGVPPIPASRERLRINGVDTVAELYAQAEWINQLARTRDIYTMHKEFRKMLGDCYVHLVPDVILDTGDVTPLLARPTDIDFKPYVLDELAKVESICKAFLDDGPFDLEAAVDGMQFVQTLGVGDTLMLRRNPDAKPQAKLMGTYTIMRAAAKKARSLIRQTQRKGADGWLRRKQ